MDILFLFKIATGLYVDENTINQSIFMIELFALYWSQFAFLFFIKTLSLLNESIQPCMDFKVLNLF